MRSIVGHPKVTKRAHPCIFAMILDRGGTLTPKYVAKLGLGGIDLGKIKSVGELQHKRSLNIG